MQILLIEDDAKARQRLIIKLNDIQRDTGLACGIDAFSDPIVALEAAQKTHYHLVMVSYTLQAGGIARFLQAFDTLQPDRMRVVLSDPEDYPALHRPGAGFSGCHIVPKEASHALLAELLDGIMPLQKKAKREKALPLPRPSLTTLRLLPMLARLDDALLQHLAGMATWRRHEPGEVIIRQNEGAEDIYFIVTGFAKVYRGSSHAAPSRSSTSGERRNRQRPSVMVALLGPGQVFGEVSFLLGIERSASIVALTPCESVSLPGQHFLDAVQKDGSFALELARELARRLVESNRQMELMRGDISGRIHALFRECRAMGLDAEQWLSNAEIARMVGATRVAVSQIVNGRTPAKPPVKSGLPPAK